MTLASCSSYLQGLRLRATRLDSCGAPLAGACSTVVSKGFINIALGVNETKPTEISQVLADGTRCYFRETPKLLNNVQATIEMCQVDPTLFEMLTGSPLIFDDALTPVAHGFTTDSASYGVANVALEVWLNLDPDGCTGNGRRWGYYLIPWLYLATVDKPTISNGAVNFVIKDGFSREGNLWGVGPYNVQLDRHGVPSPLYTPLASSAHDLLYKVNLPPPNPTCGCTALVLPS